MLTFIQAFFRAGHIDKALKRTLFDYQIVFLKNDNLIVIANCSGHKAPLAKFAIDKQF